MQNQNSKKVKAQEQLQHRGSGNAPLVQRQITLQQRSGPLPDPEELSKYEEIQPGFAERIVSMGEREQLHRHTSEDVILRNQHSQHKRDTDTFRIGQFLGVFAVLVIVWLCYQLLICGHPAEAATVATCVIVGLAAVFVVRNIKDAKEEKKSSIEEPTQ